MQELNPIGILKYFWGEGVKKKFPLPLNILFGNEKKGRNKNIQTHFLQSWVLFFIMANYEISSLMPSNTTPTQDYELNL